MRSYRRPIIFYVRIATMAASRTERGMSLINQLRQKPADLTTASKYTALNGIGYLVVGAILILWPGVTQTLFREAAFVGHEQALMRVIGLTVVVIGWLYLFGGRSSATIRCRFSDRQTGVRACCTNSARDCRCVSSTVFNVHASRCLAGSRCVDFACPRVSAGNALYVIVLLGSPYPALVYVISSAASALSCTANFQPLLAAGLHVAVQGVCVHC